MEVIKDSLSSPPSLSHNQLHRIMQIFAGVLFSLVQRLDGTFFFAYISEAAEALYELTVTEILADADRVHQQLHPQDQAAYWEVLQQSRVHSSRFCHQWRIITPAGQLKWIRCTAQAEVKENGEIVWDGILEDITTSQQELATRQQLERELRNLTDRLSLALKSGDIGCWDWNIQENTSFWDQRMYELYGLSGPSPDLPNCEILNRLIHPEDCRAAQSLLAQAIAGKAEYDTEFRVIRPDGEIRFIKAYGTVIRNEKGRARRVIGINFDITEQKKAQEILRLSEERFRKVFENAPIGMAIASLQGEIFSTNQALCEFLNYEETKLVGCFLGELTYTEDRAITQNYMAEFQQGKREKIHLEKRYLTRLGKIVWGLIAISLVRDSQGNPLFLIKQIQDITQRKQTEQKLRESQQFIQTILDTIPLPLFWKNQDSVFLGCNWPLARLLQLNHPQDIIGKTDFDLSPTQEQAIAYRLGDERVMLSGKAELRLEESHVLTSGKLQWIETHKAPLRDAYQNVVGVVGVFQDITDRKVSEFKLQQQNQELQILLKMREEALTLREDMSNMIVHDLRNPLSSILLSVNILNQYLTKGANPGILKSKLQQISVSGQRLQNMIDSLLVMAKLESGKFLLNPVPTDLHKLGQMIHRDFELMANSYQVKFRVQLPEPAQKILIDETILRRVIDNLLTNAFKFSPKEGLIQLSLEYLPQGQCRIQVADQGPGIKKSQEQEIFKKFEIGTVKKNVAQIGLGLAFCKMAVEAQGGSLLLAPNEPQGSIFTVIV